MVAQRRVLDCRLMAHLRCQRFLTTPHRLACFWGLVYMAAPQPHFECLMLITALTLVAVHSDCAVSALWCQEMPQGGPIAAHYSLRKGQLGVRDGSHHCKSAGHWCVVVQGFDLARR